MRPVDHSSADLYPEHLAATLAQLCEREGLDPCETGCVIIEGLAWTPRQPQEPGWSQRAGDPDSPSATATDEQAIRQRAYEIWEAEGRPDGRSLEHWCRAEAELAGNDGD